MFSSVCEGLREIWIRKKGIFNCLSPFFQLLERNLARVILNRLIKSVWEQSLPESQCGFKHIFVWLREFHVYKIVLQYSQNWVRLNIFLYLLVVFVSGCYRFCSKCCIFALSRPTSTRRNALFESLFSLCVSTLIRFVTLFQVTPIVLQFRAWYR